MNTSVLEVCVFFQAILKSRIHQALSSDWLVQDCNQQVNGTVKKETGKGLKISLKLSTRQKKPWLQNLCKPDSIFVFSCSNMSLSLKDLGKTHFAKAFNSKRERRCENKHLLTTGASLCLTLPEKKKLHSVADYNSLPVSLSPSLTLLISELVCEYTRQIIAFYCSVSLKVSFIIVNTQANFYNDGCDTI